MKEINPGQTNYVTLAYTLKNKNEPVIVRVYTGTGPNSGMPIYGKMRSLK